MSALADRLENEGGGSQLERPTALRNVLSCANKTTTILKPRCQTIEEHMEKKSPSPIIAKAGRLGWRKLALSFV